ncbi:MAG TPA: hypothetical protein VJ921_04745 [Vicinamibacteria bacterium]|nr:hypothetical protein [Vicinamibacteria bacterium]
MAILLAILLALAACGAPDDRAAEPAESKLQPSAPPPGESRPLKEGFPQRPPRDTPGLPPPGKPLFTEGELAGIDSRSPTASPAERTNAEADLVARLEEFERTSDPSALREHAIESAKKGWIPYRTAEELFREFLFPNDEEAAAKRYRGRVVLLTGTIAPHNMTDLADGFKLVEQTPYVHEPVLLATEYELSFVRCHLVRPEMQKLRDWQDVHLLGIVEGKLRGDLVLRRCVDISEP